MASIIVTMANAKPKHKAVVEELHGIECIKLIYGDELFNSRIRVIYNEEDVFMVDSAYNEDNYTLSICHSCEYMNQIYLKTNRKRRWVGTKEKIRKHIVKLLNEVKIYNTSKIKAESTKDIVQEFTDIHEAIGTSGDSITNAVNELSDGKPVVRIQYDKSKNKLRAYADWKGKGMLCKFPSKLKAEGACYVVDDLVEQNGYWQVKGEIKHLVE